jgi:2-(1,2-epoxy-1,2-dihydrophenyl)acetyl-CoA isomerase
MSYSTLLFSVQDGVAHVTLNRPDAANSMNAEMMQDLFDVMLRCDEDPVVRVVLLSGSGAFFCAGGDLKAFAAEDDDLPMYIKRGIIALHAAVSRMARMSAPVIAAVQGTAAGAGFSLACACDLVLAAESARFMMAYTRVGLTPDGSLTYYLPRAVGPKRALDLALTNRMLSAQEALDWGIVTRVVADDAIMDEANALAKQLAQGARLAMAGAKRLLHSGLTETLETQMELEAISLADMARTADAREGITAFLEKREAQFKGE